jgi:hypothetical protein
MAKNPDTVTYEKALMKNLKIILIGCGLALLCGAAGRAQTPDKEAITPTARIELFNGKDFTGWQFATKGDGDPKAPWSVADGVIKCTGKPNGYIRTEQAYHDYKITVEWRFTKPGNTGVLVHMHLPDKVWPLCIECQGMHDKQGDFWMQGGAECKDHHGTAREQRYVPMRVPSQEKPVGEWNTYEAICSGNTIKIVVNGTLMNEATECTVTSGFIGLQSEGGELEIRKVFVEPLPSG